jgi:hypothetical protein
VGKTLQAEKFERVVVRGANWVGDAVMTVPALRELRRAFGPPAPPTQGDASVAVGSPRQGWTVASWAVSHARAYGLSEIRYAGRHWTADNGYAGWTKDEKAPTDRVLIK